jgi:hypothetical protein
MRDTVMKLLQKYGVMARYEVFDFLKINKDNEEDRKKVWQVSTALSSLERDKFIRIYTILRVKTIALA